MTEVDREKENLSPTKPVHCSRSVHDINLESLVSLLNEMPETHLVNTVNDDRLLFMEEESPLQTTLIDHDEVWRLSLTAFTSKKHGNETNLPKSLRRYYKKQDELINTFEELDAMNENSTEADDANKVLLKNAAILAKASFIINLLLLCGKAVAAGLSGSLAVITSVIDSAVDLVSGILMWWSSLTVRKRDPYNYPQGRTRLEPIAIVVLSVVMALASVQMILKAFEAIIGFATFDLQPPYLHNDSDVMCINISNMKQYIRPEGQGGPIFAVESITICVATICVKLILFIVCRRIAIQSTQALAQDHRNDVISNSGALVCGLIGYRLWKYADPIGAIIISIYIIISWFITGWNQTKMLTGYAATPDFVKKLTFMAVNHHPKIKHIETVRAFHFGANFLVEVDIVLPESMNLREAHDIGETLQRKLEKLEEVERAFVHVDFDAEHSPDMEHKLV